MHDPDGYFGERIAAAYDENAAGLFDPAVVDPAVDSLTELAGQGRALELGIGTGRLAPPLAARGVEVHGIELSRAMIDRLRDKPGAELRERWSSWTREPFTADSLEHISVWQKPS